MHVKPFETDEKIFRTIDESITLFYDTIRRQDDGLDKRDESFFSFSSVCLFSGENCLWSPWVFFLITWWFSVDTFSENASWMTLICWTVCWDCFSSWSLTSRIYVPFLKKYILYPAFILLSPTYNINQLLLLNTFSFPRSFLLISSIFLSFDNWIFFHLLINLYLSFWLFLVPSRMLWMLVAMNKWMICAIRFGNNNVGNNFFKNMFSVSNEMTAILVTRFLGNESKKRLRTNFLSVCPKTATRKRRRRRKKGNCKAFCVTSKQQSFWYQHLCWGKSNSWL